MSRTHRNAHYNSCALRKPKTQRERKQLDSILDEVQFTGYNVSNIHSRMSKLVHQNDDNVISAYYEMDYE
jgi:hypothetical protein